jgi:hypothetical protein
LTLGRPRRPKSTAAETGWSCPWAGHADSDRSW